MNLKQLKILINSYTLKLNKSKIYVISKNKDN